MLTVFVASCLLVVGTTLLHYEVLRILNRALGALRIPNRSKILVVILTTFLAHAVEIALYGVAIYILISQLGAGQLVGLSELSVEACIYLSAETYTSLGFGDVTPIGPVRMIAGVEALNGLLLITWSASFTYLSMERFWVSKPSTRDKRDSGQA